MNSILLLPIIELIVMGVLAGLVGVLTVLNRQVFFAEAITHATFPGAVLGVVVGSALGMGHQGLSVMLFIGALLMCLPLGALFGLARIGTATSAAGIVLTLGFALGYFLNKWFAPLPIKVESFLVGNVLNVTVVDVAITSALLIITLIIVVVGWRRLFFFAFDRSAFSVRHDATLAQAIISTLIVVTLVVLIPAVGTILSIGLLAAPATALRGVIHRPGMLLVCAPIVGVVIGLSGLGIAVVFNLSAGGCIGVMAGVVYLTIKGIARISSQLTT